MKLKRANNLLRKKQCNWIGIWSQLEVVKVDSKEENERSTKEELKNHMVQFRMTMQNGLEKRFVLQV